ncbi:MAG: acyl-CoA thioesterase [Chlorobi bacterium]|nr:acyl-CoA thioesterase [Chlorobiota bacterium]
MLKYTTTIRVRYADTDKMQFVYNGKYLEYFEVGRTELLRSVGLPYSEIEKAGYQLPLREAGLKFKQPAVYDDLLDVEAAVEKLYTAEVYIKYKITRKGTDVLIAEGFTSHMFIHEESKKPAKPPKIYIEKLAKYF